MRRHLPLAPLALGVLAAALAAGCAGPPGGFVLPDALPDGLAADEVLERLGLRFADPYQRFDVELDHERRPALVTSVAGWSWRGEVPADGRLVVGVQALPVAWRHIDRFDARIELSEPGGSNGTTGSSDGSRPQVLERVHAERGGEQRWFDLDLDLGRWAGRTVELGFRAALDPLPDEHRAAPLVAWAPVGLGGGGPGDDRDRRDGRPNVLWIVVDTLRADHLTPYGYRRDTSPEIASRLAARGAVVETAYSQAPWTLPSVISYFTGRYPGELLAGGIAGFAIPEGAATVPERLHEMGYATGGFFANPTLHAGIGFGRGFDTFYTPEPVVASMTRHADDVNRRAVSWLAARQRRPFFLYVHYIDPHDPYENPDVVAGRSPYLPDYRGRLTGGSVHGVYLGKVPLAHPRRDVAQLTALYDSEVHYVDRAIGALLASLDPEVAADTLIVLTADHGEELHDHGGWKHGETLYQELVRVPLIVRWDRRIPAGTRLDGTVRLVDLAPTLLGAAGSPAAAGRWDGVDLLPALTGEGPLPRRTAFSEHLSSGPLRAAAVVGGWKLVLFNRAAPYAPADEVQAILWRRDRERLERVELYDLAADPGERTNLAAAHPDRVAALQPAIDRRLDRELPGLRIVTGELADGAVLTGAIVFRQPPTGWLPHFLGPADRGELAGRRLELTLVGEPLAKGVRVLGDTGGVESIELNLDGAPLPPGRVAVGARGRWQGAPLPVSALTAPAPPDSGGVALRLWTPAGEPRLARPGQESAETRRRLKALGYLQ